MSMTTTCLDPGSKGDTGSVGMMYHRLAVEPLMDSVHELFVNFVARSNAGGGRILTR